MTDIRQCNRCNTPAMLLVMNWQHTTWGASTGQSTEEWRCQACGTWAVKRRKTTVWALWICGVLFCFFPPAAALCLWLAYRQHTFDRRHPLIDGVPPPKMNFPGGPPVRRCAACGKDSVAIRITRHTHNGVPTGTDFDYQCTGCKQEFSTQNALGLSMQALMTLAVLGITAAFFFQGTTPAWKWGGTAVFAGITGLLGFQLVKHVANRFQNPPVVRSMRSD